MTDMNDTIDTGTASNDYETGWSAPERLSPPPSVRAGLPILAILAAAGVSLAAGAALFVLGQFIYIYIITSVVVGRGVGWALGLAPRKAAFTNLAVLGPLLVVFTTAPFLLMRVGFYLSSAQELSFPQYFMRLMEVDTLFGLELGLFGNLAILVAEIGYAIYVGWSALRVQMKHATIERMPSDAVAFVVNALVHGWDEARVDAGLAGYGWSDANQREEVIATGYQVVASANT